VATGPTIDGPLRETSYLVFSQGPAAAPDVTAWDAHATRFFDARLGLAEVPRTTGPAIGLRVVVAPRAGGSGIRRVVGRPRDADDRAMAEAAEAKSGGGGLATLARRCPHVWLVCRESEPDMVALLLATVLASASLGPVLDVRTLDLFGVKSARAKLAGA
jgi:hypothetical protein